MSNKIALEALTDAKRAINSMKVEAETAGAGGDQEMLQDACEQISNEGLAADTAIRAAIAALEAMEPVACLVNADAGAMVWPISDINEAGTYCDEGEFPELLYPAAAVSALQARIATQAEHQAKALEGVEPIGYIAWRDGKPAWSEDCVCEDAVFPRDIEDDCTSMAIYPATTVSALQARIAELESELRRVTTSPPTGSAPCARLCEHMAFQIQAKSDARRIAELEALLQEAGRTIDNLTVYNRAIGHCITAIKEALK